MSCQVVRTSITLREWHTAAHNKTGAEALIWPVSDSRGIFKISSKKNSLCASELRHFPENEALSDMKSHNNQRYSKCQSSPRLSHPQHSGNLFTNQKRHSGAQPCSPPGIGNKVQSCCFFVFF